MWKQAFLMITNVTGTMADGLDIIIICRLTVSIITNFVHLSAWSVQESKLILLSVDVIH